MPYSMQRYKKRGIRYAGAVAAGRAARAGYDYLTRRYKRARTSGAASSSTARAQMMSGSFSGTTTQHDRVRQYRRGRRRPNRRWKRFKRKVKAVLNTELGPQTRVFNYAGSATNASVLLNGIYEEHMYHQSDLNTLANDMNVGNPTAAAGITVAESTKLRFRTGILDMTVRNTSYLSSSGAIDSAYALEVDLYEIRFPSMSRDSTTAYTTIASSVTSSMGEQKRIGGAGTSVWSTVDSKPYRGSTPFELSRWLSEHKIKILKKTKYFLNGGSTFTHQFKDRKDRYTTLGEINDNTGFTYRNWTYSVWIFFKLVPGLTVGVGAGEITERLQVGATRKYLYSYEGQNESKDRYN